MALTPASYETIKNQLRFSLSTPGSYAKRNRGAHKRAFLTGVAQQASGYEWLAELCETTQEDVAIVAQSVLDKWDGKGEWLAERMANVQIALDNARRYTEQAADSAAQAEQLPEPHKGWANSNAALFAEKAAFFTAQAAQIAAR
jgi:hypothetical protein